MRCSPSLLLLLLGACVEPTISQPATVDGGGLDSGNSTPPATADYYRFSGKLAATATVPFGGSPYCDYAVTMRDIVVDVVVRETGHLVTGLVTNNRIEQSLNGCPHAPAPPNAQVYEHRGSPIAGETMFVAALVGRSSNSPQAALDLAITAPNEQLPTATIQWRRTDVGPPLDWTVNARGLELQAIPCTAGAAVCVGRDEGTLYHCLDGQRMRESKRCAAGCASTTACN